VPELGFHFAEPWWLLGFIVILPLAWWRWHSAQRAEQGPIHLYADSHLLPHLSGTQELQPQERWANFSYWLLLWTLALLAMAGPRWDYTDVRLFHPGNNLLVLLDISRSMQVTDVSPSRLSRAKQELQDLLTLNRMTRIGLIAFASVPQVVTPITEDMGTLLNALPAIETDLVKLQGSRLLTALDRAEILLNGLPEDSSKTILLISDGDFDESGLGDRIRKLAQKDIKLITLGIGTTSGSTVPDLFGRPLLDRQRQPIISTLHAAELTRLAEAGQGFYQEASFRQTDTKAILQAAAQAQIVPDTFNDTTRIWNERFFLLLIPLLALLLPMFRRPARLQ
jgi:Ca-activated chloride channel family protein